MMKKNIFLFVFLFFTLSIKSQDVIVLKDGTTIISKVTETNQEEVKYKKSNNLDGPTYAISKNDIFTINYENGEKELFSSENSTNTNGTANNSELSQEDILINDGIVSNYNDRTVISKLRKNDKKAKWVYRLLKLHPASVAGNSDGRLYIQVSQIKESANTKASMCVSIENTSNEIMYVDLGSSSFRQLKNATTYFVSSSTTTSSTSAIGTSVLGIAYNNSSSLSTTKYAERIVTIPPHSIYKLSEKMFYNTYYVAPYKRDFKIGDRFAYYCPSDFAETPWEIVISYAMESNLDKMKKFDTGIYLSEEISVESSWDKCFEEGTGLSPIHYYYRVK